MKKLWITGWTIALLATQQLMGATITTTSTGFNGGLNGGEFSSVTSANGTFITFCLEETEYFYLGHQYTYELSGAAIRGSYNHDLSTPGMDILSQGSAYLYALFATGTLAGYDADHNANAGNLQNALWALEDEKSYADAGGGGANPYITLVENAFGTFANAQLDYSGSSVKVVNVYDLSNSDGLSGSYGIYRQDFLIYVPDGGFTIFLFGMALSGVAIVSRRLRH